VRPFYCGMAILQVYGEMSLQGKLQHQAWKGPEE